MPVISIINEKGGVGKTTLTVHIARCLQKMGEDVLLIDSDPQGSLRDWHASAGDDNDLPPLIAMDRDAQFKDLPSFTKKWTLIDGAPSAQRITATIVKCSDYVIIPVQPSPYDVWATESLVEMITARHEVSDKPQAGFLISRQISGAKLSKDIREALESYGLHIFSSCTAQRVIYPTSAARGSTALDDEPSGQASIEIRKIVEEIKQWVS